MQVGAALLSGGLGLVKGLHANDQKIAIAHQGHEHIGRSLDVAAVGADIEKEAVLEGQWQAERIIDEVAQGIHVGHNPPMHRLPFYYNTSFTEKISFLSNNRFYFCILKNSSRGYPEKIVPSIDFFRDM